MKNVNVNLQPNYAEIADSHVQRAIQVIVPQGTSPEAATKAIREKVDRWLDWLKDDQYLKLLSKVHVTGPKFCPWTEDKAGRDVFGEDLYFVAALFGSEKPRKVDRAVIVGNRRLSEKVGMSYEEFTAPQKALPDDLDEQMQHVADNPDQVYADLKDKDKKQDDKEAHHERFG